MLNKYISHRGNLTESNPKMENHPDYIRAAIAEGFDVEIDVWCIYRDDKIYLGHDAPQYEVGLEFLETPGLWCHAKNIGALSKLFQKGIHVFWHQEDDCTITSERYIWVYPGRPICSGSIAVMPERCSDWDIAGAVGICSDRVKLYRDQNNIF